MLELMRLKNYLLSNGINTENQLKKTDVYVDFEKYIKTINLKTFKVDTLIKLLLTEDNFYCKCGKSIRSYNHNARKFRDYCKYCKYLTFNISESIKTSRKNETTYNGILLLLPDLIIKLNNIDMSKYLCSGCQRKFIKEHPEIYFSILNLTTDIDNVKGINIRGRIDHLLHKSGTCKCGKQILTYNNYTLKFNPVCTVCMPKKNSLEYYKLYFPNNYEEIYKADREKRKLAARNMHSEEWYIQKYGLILGKDKFNSHINNMLSNRNSRSSSKISLNLFNNLVLEGFSDAVFATHPKEQMFVLSDEYVKILGQQKIFVDFVYKNKIIEFQGDYWHAKTKDKDNIRKQFLKSIGYDVLFIYENEYKEDNIRELQKCKRFLEGNKVQNRYKILAENGYEHFDNIINTGNNETLIFELEQTKIEVSINHKFFKNKKEINAIDLVVGETLQTKDGNQKIISITNGNSTTYEVLETESHSYFANDVLNHNCEFLGSSHTLISADKLSTMKPSEAIRLRDGKLKIYHDPEPGHKYIMSVDPAKDGTDAFAVQIVDITDFRFVQVASAELQIDYLLMPEFINEWGREYNNAYLIIENNEGAGQSIADQLYQGFEYDNLHFDKDVGRNKKKKYPGFRTTSKSRKQILQTLKLFIENDKLEINDKKTINEFYQFILVNGKFQADDGAHDDMIMSLALIFAPFCDTKNFEDIRKVVQQLYLVEPQEDEEKIGFGDMLTIGDFDSATDDDYESYSAIIRKEYTSMEDALSDMDGLI